VSVVPQIMETEEYISIRLDDFHNAIMDFENNYTKSLSTQNLQRQQLGIIQYQAETNRYAVYVQQQANHQNYDVAKRRNHTEHLRVATSITFDSTIRKKDYTQRIAIILGFTLGILTLFSSTVHFLIKMTVL